MKTVRDFIWGASKTNADGDCSHEIKRCLLLGRKFMTNLDSMLKSRHYFTDKGPSSQSDGFWSSHVWMWELDYKESWALKHWCFQTVVLEKTLESPLEYNGIKSVHPKGNQSCVFIGRIDAEAETPILWPPDEELTHWKRPWCWERLRAGGEGGDRGDGWMASLTQWAWVWVRFGSWWWTGRPGMLQSMGSQSRTWLSGWTELTHVPLSPWNARKYGLLYWTPALIPYIIRYNISKGDKGDPALTRHRH